MRLEFIKPRGVQVRKITGELHGSMYRGDLPPVITVSGTDICVCIHVLPDYSCMGLHGCITRVAALYIA